MPVEVLQVLPTTGDSRPDCLQRYSDHRRWIHATDIQNRLAIVISPIRASAFT
ncbi:hypothetical protein P4133_31335 [Pseudomonas aeruginosa]|nr:hypothetical protein [Pseudomonas aeruginosa]